MKTKHIKPLAMLRPGEIGTIIQILAGRGLTLRLIEMGITIGSQVMILHNNSGPIIIQIRNSRLILGRGVAMKILVEVN